MEQEPSVFLGESCWRTSLSACSPGGVLESGGVASFLTSDATYLALSRGLRVPLEQANVVCGPLQVQSAAPGDALRVDVLSIRISRCWSVWSSDTRCCGCLAAKRAAAGLEQASVRELRIEHEKSSIRVSERLAVPLRPMIGVIATASADPTKASTFEPTYPNGGNMDLRQLEPGASIVLPVLVPGGLLFVGDLHAAMGEGEPTWVGFESAGTAVVRVTLLKNTPMRFPRLYLPGDRIVFSALANGQGIGADISPHDEAMQDALGQAFDYLIEVEKLTFEEAFGFLTAQAAATFGGPASRQALVTIESPKRFFVTDK